MDSYLYGTLYTYLPATQLAIWQACLSKLNRYSENVPNQLIQAASFNARALFPNIKDPAMSDIEFLQVRKREHMIESLSKEEQEELFNKEAEELSTHLNSLSYKEISATFYTEQKPLPNAAIDKFIEDSNKAIEPLLKALVPKESFLEDIIIAYHKHKSNHYFYPLLIAWRELRILHEGCPPYKIKFSQTFIDQMTNIDPSFDPIMASIATESAQITARSTKRIAAGLNVARKQLPELVTPEIYQALISKIQ